MTPVLREATIEWMDAALDKRLASSHGQIQRSVERAGWLGNPTTGEVSAWDSYDGDRSKASWLPTRSAAEKWRALADF